MNTLNRENIFFAIFVAAVIVLAAIYFSVPERMDFLDFNIRWWKELLLALKSFSYMRIEI
ncbi:MAG: hypothetical protein AB1499_00740 [Nitrospirota bacterium]